MTQKLHPCAAAGCPHLTAYTWCSALHSPREAERDRHRRSPAGRSTPTERPPRRQVA